MSPEPIDHGLASGPRQHHVLSVLVENKAGVLSRVAGLFSRRGFNIYSLAVAPTDRSHRFSRITIVVDAASAPLSQVVRQLDKLINVVQINHLNERSVVERELLLATVLVDAEGADAVAVDCARAGAEIVDRAPGALTVMLAGTPIEVEAFETLLAAHTVAELHRTGLVALPKLPAPPGAAADPGAAG